MVSHTSIEPVYALYPAYIDISWQAYLCMTYIQLALAFRGCPHPPTVTLSFRRTLCKVRSAGRLYGCLRFHICHIPSFINMMWSWSPPLFLSPAPCSKSGSLLPILGFSTSSYDFLSDFGLLEFFFLPNILPFFHHPHFQPWDVHGK